MATVPAVVKNRFADECSGARCAVRRKAPVGIGRNPYVAAPVGQQNEVEVVRALSRVLCS